jgi:hypothetical protein
MQSKKPIFKQRRICLPQKKFWVLGLILFMGAVVFAGSYCLIFDCRLQYYSFFVDNFEECAAKGFPVTASNPPRCYIGKQEFVRSPVHIRVFEPEDNQVITSPVKISGEARALNNEVGYRIIDDQGQELTKGVIPANSPEHGRWGSYAEIVSFTSSNAQTARVEVFDLTPEGQAINKQSVPVLLKIPEERTSNSENEELLDLDLEVEPIDLLSSLEGQEISEMSKLEVPFTSQAPFADWSQPYDEACEEASLLMAKHYLTGEPLDQERANTEIILLTDWQANEGYRVDVSISQLQEIAQDYFELESAIYYDDKVTAENIKKIISAGYPVIVPAAGQLLENPYFRGAGPPYHMLVITGYDQDEFYTNDPGTSRGEDFKYSISNLMNAVHDWTGDKSTIREGRKAMMVVVE